VPLPRLAGRQRFARHGGLLGLGICAPLVGLLVPDLPLIAAGLTTMLAITIAALASPGGFITMAALLSTAIPKAGFVIGGFPLPVMMFVLLVAGLLLRWHTYAPVIQRRGSRLGVAALAWLVYRLILMHLDGGGLGDMLALAGWYGLPVGLLLVGPALGALRGERGEQWVAYLEAGLLIACGFSVVQQLGGIERTALPGVTRAVGADYSVKPLLFAGGSKIPSTYQNGNILGVITAFFFLTAAERVLGGKGRRQDLLIMTSTAVASVLSGSRTILIGLAVGLVVLVLRSGLNRRTVVVVLLAASAFVGVLQVSPALYHRLIGTKASDPALADRSVVWKKVLRSTSVAELLAGGPDWAQRNLDPGLAEGMVGATQQVGVIGMVLFLGTFWAATNGPELRRWRVVLIPVAVSLAVDSAYLVFPTIFLPIARMFAPLRPDTRPPLPEHPNASLQGRSSAPV
jgi:hypothetical protein